MALLLILMAVIAGGFLLAWIGDAVNAAATRRVRDVEVFDQSVHCRVVER